ncbi:hypothetical protein JCGZ_15267 [Jatropha curcas]|uniref:Uncharacterized protein n=1 Tax=Jatropha curcas TaxID=180498 RepID=A0A067K684_JATCU|nr:hypothetical protein JCGZ_15267 [Jatropha curcas]
MYRALFHSLARADWDILLPFEAGWAELPLKFLSLTQVIKRLIKHFDNSDNLFRHNDFEIYPLFKEFTTISSSIPVIEEIPTVPLLDIDPASLILLIFRFSTYEILTYELRADVVTLRPVVEHALRMDHASSRRSNFAPKRSLDQGLRKLGSFIHCYLIFKRISKSLLKICSGFGWEGNQGSATKGFLCLYGVRPKLLA